MRLALGLRRKVTLKAPVINRIPVRRRLNSYSRSPGVKERPRSALLDEGPSLPAVRKLATVRGIRLQAAVVARTQSRGAGGQLRPFRSCRCLRLGLRRIFAANLSYHIANLHPGREDSLHGGVRRDLWDLDSPRREPHQRLLPRCDGPHEAVDAGVIGHALVAQVGEVGAVWTGKVSALLSLRWLKHVLMLMEISLGW